MDRKKIDKIFEAASGKRICIIGDIMLDRYMFGNVNRISPEAPVQVFDLKESISKLGGAANVSLNIKSLGAEPFLIGVIGNDGAGKILRDEMRNLGQDTSGLITDSSRPTTCKTRVISDSHHLIRIDSESKQDISAQIEAQIISKLGEISSDTNYIILQDYNKGVLTKPLIKKILAHAVKKKIKVLVDPKFENFFEFRETFLFKPNRNKNMEDAFGKKLKTAGDPNELVMSLIKKLKCKKRRSHARRARNENLQQGKTEKIVVSSVKTVAKKVADVSGCG
ncbi:MAG: bifunctional heptose 7-phosphate kinase/heptose 1-phosphate adenyltransferase [Ignavibacteria bacterium]